MTITAGDVVADDTGLPALDELLKLALGKIFDITEEFEPSKDFDPAVHLPGWTSVRILAACAVYAGIKEVAGPEERWLMGTPTRFTYNMPADDRGTYRKRAYGLWRFLHVQRALARLAPLQTAPDWREVQGALDGDSRELLTAESLKFDDLPAFLAAVSVAQSVRRTAALGRPLEPRRLRVINHADWPDVRRFLQNSSPDMIGILENPSGALLGPSYVPRLQAAILEVERLLRTWDQPAYQMPRPRRGGGGRPRKDRKQRLTKVVASSDAKAAVRGPDVLGPRTARPH